MTPRELYFVTHHQAAQIVAALTLGCRVDHVVAGTGPQENAWSLEAAPIEDAASVCAAGFEMEILLGRLHEHAWTRSQQDRALLGELHSDRTGDVLDEARLEERFMQGAASSRAILEHQTSRKAIDLLADALSDVYGSKERKMTGVDIRTITGMETAIKAAPALVNEVK